MSNLEIFKLVVHPIYIRDADFMRKEPRPANIELSLSTGRRCVLVQPQLPGLRGYYVLALPTRGSSAGEAEEFRQLVHRVARRLGQVVDHARAGVCPRDAAVERARRTQQSSLHAAGAGHR